MNPLLTDEDKSEICFLYKSGVPIKKLTEEFDVSPQTVYRGLEEFGVKRTLTYKQRRKFSNALPINHKSFSSLNEKSSYWIGFLMADGSIRKSQNGKSFYVSLALGKKDREHLVKFKTFLQSEHKISPKNSTEGSEGLFQITFSSPQIGYDLLNYGVEPNKSGRAKAKNGIEKCPSFWRGVIDGDGCIYMGPNGNRPQLRLYGSEALLRQFKGFINEFEDTSAKVTRRNRERGSYFIGVNGRYLATSVIKKIYRNSKVHLDRKKKQANEVMEKFGERGASADEGDCS